MKKNIIKTSIAIVVAVTLVTLGCKLTKKQKKIIDKIYDDD